ncbi:hypothetical protein ABT160_00010 [Streptomyces sp. NPDC001941]|uniref:hypothetical protein n=1 Tax=Streptomyces sp. NPDC001941 TaxID=3154659 RepID=UPI003325195C
MKTAEMTEEKPAKPAGEFTPVIAAPVSADTLEIPEIAEIPDIPGPLTSEPPMADVTPLTSEPPMAEVPLTSEPTAPAYEAAGCAESPGV